MSLRSSWTGSHRCSSGAQLCLLKNLSRYLLTLRFYVSELCRIGKHAHHINRGHQESTSKQIMNDCMTYAKSGGLLAYMVLSTILLALSGILRGSKACSMTPGLLFPISHIMSSVLSSPYIVDFKSKFGLLVNCVLMVWVMRLTNWRCKYSNYFLMKVEVGLILLLFNTFFDL